jgi:hypothetical protein
METSKTKMVSVHAVMAYGGNVGIATCLLTLTIGEGKGSSFTTAKNYPIPIK